jgi:hypothetical protein
MKTEIVDISNSTEDFYIGDIVQKGEEDALQHVPGNLETAKEITKFGIIVEINEIAKSAEVVFYDNVALTEVP